MIPDHKKRWFTPRFAINTFWDLYKQVGEDALSKDKYKKELEAWITGTALLGVHRIFGTHWWLQIPKSEPPDITIMDMLTDREKTVFRYRPVEVSQITKHTNRTIVEEIKKKLKYMFYEKETSVIFYLRREANIEDMRLLSDDLKKDEVRVSDI
jgi:hypothetical protein